MRHSQDPPLEILANPWTRIAASAALSSSYSTSSSASSLPTPTTPGYHASTARLSGINKDLKQRTFIFSGDYWPAASVRTPHRHTASISREALLAHAFEPPAKGFDFEDRVSAPDYAKVLYESVAVAGQGTGAMGNSNSVRSDHLNVNNVMMTPPDGVSLESLAESIFHQAQTHFHTPAHSRSSSGCSGWRSLSRRTPSPFSSPDELAESEGASGSDDTVRPGYVKGSYFPLVLPEATGSRPTPRWRDGGRDVGDEKRRRMHVGSGYMHTRSHPPTPAFDNGGKFGPSPSYSVLQTPHTLDALSDAQTSPNHTPRPSSSSPHKFRRPPILRSRSDPVSLETKTLNNETAGNAHSHTQPNLALSTSSDGSRGVHAPLGPPGPVPTTAATSSTLSQGLRLDSPVVHTAESLNNNPTTTSLLSSHSSPARPQLRIGRRYGDGDFIHGCIQAGTDEEKACRKHIVAVAPDWENSGDGSSRSGGNNAQTTNVLVRGDEDGDDDVHPRTRASTRLAASADERVCSKLEGGGDKRGTRRGAGATTAETDLDVDFSFSLSVGSDSTTQRDLDGGTEFGGNGNKEGTSRSSVPWPPTAPSISFDADVPLSFGGFALSSVAATDLGRDLNLLLHQQEHRQRQHRIRFSSSSSYPSFGNSSRSSSSLDSRSRHQSGANINLTLSTEAESETTATIIRNRRTGNGPSSRLDLVSVSASASGPVYGSGSGSVCCAHSSADLEQLLSPLSAHVLGGLDWTRERGVRVAMSETEDGSGREVGFSERREGRDYGRGGVDLIAPLSSLETEVAHTGRHMWDEALDPNDPEESSPLSPNTATPSTLTPPTPTLARCAGLSSRHFPPPPTPCPPQPIKSPAKALDTTSKAATAVYVYPPPGTFRSSYSKVLRSEQARTRCETRAETRRGSVVGSATGARVGFPASSRAVQEAQASSSPSQSPSASKAGAEEEGIVLSISELDVWGAEAYKRGVDWYSSWPGMPTSPICAGVSAR